MVTIPDYQARQGLEAPNYPRVQLDDSIGQSLQRVGGALAGMAERLAERDRQRELFNANVAAQLLQEQMNTELEKAVRNASADGAGLHDSFMGNVAMPKIREFLDGIRNPELRERFAAQSAVWLEAYGNKAADQEYRLGNKYARDNIDRIWQSQQGGIATSPADVDGYIKRMEEVIDSAPNVTAAEKLEMKEGVRKQAAGIVREALRVQDPAAYRFALGGGTFDERVQFLVERLTPAVVMAESANNPKAVSPKGAIGLMQVMPATAAEIARKIGDKAFLAMTPQQKREYLQQPDVSMRYGQFYLGEQLRKYGGDVEAALIAYNAGPGNADKWLAAGRDYAVLPKRSETEPYVARIMGALGTARFAAGASNGGGVTRIPVQVGTQPGRQPVNMSGLDRRVVDMWERVQGAFGKAVPIVSAFRDAATNAAAGGATKSRHLHGDAIDVDVRGLSKSERRKLIETASAMGFTGIGVYASSLHFDLGPRRVWGPSFSKGSVPAWAYEATARHMAGKARNGGSAAGSSFPAGATGSGGQPARGAEAAAAPSAFVNPLFQGLDAASLIKAQAEAENAWQAQQEAQAIRDGFDIITRSIGDGAGSEARQQAYAMARQIEDQNIRAKIIPMLDAEFNRREEIERAKSEEEYDRSYNAVLQALGRGDQPGAYAAISPSLSPERRETLRKLVLKGPVQDDDALTQTTLTALWANDPKAFRALDVTQYLDRLTPETVQKWRREQIAMAEAERGAASADALSKRATIDSAMTYVNQGLLEIGIDTSKKGSSGGGWWQSSDDNIAIANRIREMAVNELERLQVKLGRPPLDSEIQETIRPLFLKVREAGRWWGTTETSMADVVRAYEAEGFDIGQAQRDLTANGEPVTVDTMRRYLEAWKALMAGPQ